jgi:aerobic carbon-monoxide dehydrogenase large subunit
MANEAYRAVFLRVHPTGKMVLSLTTEPDGHETDYARQVADKLGVPALDVKVVPADTPGTVDAITSATGKILTKAQLLAGVVLDSAPDALHWSDGAFATAENPSQGKTIAELAMYAHGTGALPPGVEGGLDAQTVYRD